MRLRKCNVRKSNACYSSEKTKFRGTGLIKNTFKSAHSTIEVLENSPYGPENRHSIVQFYTEESQRGKGHAVALLSKVLEEYPSNVGGQTSSAVALRILWKKGFRPYDKRIKTLEGAEKERQKLSSVYMIKD